MVHIIKGWTFSKLVSEGVVTIWDIDRNLNCCLVSQVKLSEEAQNQMRKLLKQKETNHLRLKRAKMNRSMFDVIKKLGIGAFGEVFFPVFVVVCTGDLQFVLQDKLHPAAIGF